MAPDDGRCITLVGGWEEEAQRRVSVACETNRRAALGSSSRPATHSGSNMRRHKAQGCWAVMHRRGCCPACHQSAGAALQHAAAREEQGDVHAQDNSDSNECRARPVSCAQQQQQLLQPSRGVAAGAVCSSAAPPCGRPAGRERAAGGRQDTSSNTNLGRGAICAHRCTAGMTAWQVSSWIGGRVLFFQRQQAGRQCAQLTARGKGSTAVDIGRSAWCHSSGCTTRPGCLSSTASPG